MYESFIKGLAALPTLKKEKKPGVAAFVGFMFGGIGLGLYFRSFVDCLLPIAAYVALAATTSMVAPAWLASGVIAGMYGFYRAQNSNQRRTAST